MLGLRNLRLLTREAASLLPTGVAMAASTAGECLTLLLGKSIAMSATATGLRIGESATLLTCESATVCTTAAVAGKGALLLWSKSATMAATAPTSARKCLGLLASESSAAMTVTPTTGEHRRGTAAPAVTATTAATAWIEGRSGSAAPAVTAGSKGRRGTTATAMRVAATVPITATTAVVAMRIATAAVARLR